MTRHISIFVEYIMAGALSLSLSLYIYIYIYIYTYVCVCVWVCVCVFVRACYWLVVFTSNTSASSVICHRKLNLWRCLQDLGLTRLYLYDIIKEHGS